MSKNIKKLAFSAVFVALAFGLSLIKIIHLPTGGSVTLFSMLAISLPAYYFGVHYGFLASSVYALLQMIDNLYIVHPAQVVLDYILPFVAFGIVGFFRNRKEGLTIGFIIACTIRFISSSLSGFIFFKEYAPAGTSPLIYTIIYNGGYIFTEMAITLIAIHIPKVKELIERWGRVPR